jgi:hypothetical protein
MPESKLRTLTYKRAIQAPQPGVASLSELLSRAVAAKPTIGERRQPLGTAEEAREWLVIGEYAGNEQCFFGVLMRYSPGSPAAVLLDDVNAGQVAVRALTAPSDGDLRREFIDGMMFFAVAGNHVALMQSTSVREKTFEGHLYWLLTAAGLLGGGQSVSLLNQPTQAAREAAARSPVRTIELYGDFQSVRAVERRPANRISRMIWAAAQLVRQPEHEKLNLEQLNASRLTFSLQLKYEGKRRQVEGAALDELSHALRHVDGVDTRVHLDNGDTLENEQLRTSGKVKITTYDGLPSPVEVFEVMRAWLRERLGAEVG